MGQRCPYSCATERPPGEPRRGFGLGSTELKRVGKEARGGAGGRGTAPSQRAECPSLSFPRCKPGGASVPGPLSQGCIHRASGWAPGRVRTADLALLETGGCTALPSRAVTGTSHSPAGAEPERPPHSTHLCFRQMARYKYRKASTARRSVAAQFSGKSATSFSFSTCSGMGAVTSPCSVKHADTGG